MHLLTAKEYYQQLIQSISQAKHRIRIAAMVVQVDATTQPIFEAIQAAQARGVSVHIVVDVYSRIALPHGMHHEHLRRICRHTDVIFQQLKNSGAQVDWIGKIGLNPTRHRHHIKLSIVDDRIFGFGGVNMSAESFEHIDYMLTSQDAKLADTLDTLIQRLGNKLPLADFEQPLDQAQTLLFDAGKPRQSIVYDHAYQLAQGAKHIDIVSQMVPSGRLARALRQTQYQAYFNHPMKAPDLLRVALFVDKLVARLKNSYHGTNYIHAKFLLVQMPNGTQAVLAGSHNFSWRGVVYSTTEMDLYSTDQKLCAQFKTFLDKHIAHPATEL